MISVQRIADYIGSYYVYMGGIDIIVFTAGIGRIVAAAGARSRRVKVLGVELDEEANAKARGEIGN